MHCSRLQNNEEHGPGRGFFVTRTAGGEGGGRMRTGSPVAQPDGVKGSKLHPSLRCRGLIFDRNYQVL